LTQLSDGRDKNFVCACGGDIVHVWTLEGGRKLFKCYGHDDKEHRDFLECIICHLPKTIWADDGTICANCGLKFLSGELELTKEQEEGIRKWIVSIPNTER
jgi:hypothetical protein